MKGINSEFDMTFMFNQPGIKKVVSRASEIISGKKYVKHQDLMRAFDGDIMQFIVNYFKFVVKFGRKPRIKLY